VARALRIHPSDNVAVALEAAEAGETVTAGEAAVAARDAVPFAHKIALEQIPAGGPIRKYGVAVAFATRAISPGEWVHGHNAEGYFAARRKERGA
jgi:hypothetical protein